ncbi:MAG: toxin-antitoxin system YwqK family antitoxin [Planctomycetota bacterium]
MLRSPMLIAIALVAAGCGGSRSEAPPSASARAAESQVVAEPAPPAPVVAEAVTAESAAEQVIATGFDGAVTSAYSGGGQALEASYEGGQKHGPWVSYHANGEVFERGVYQGGLRHGEWRVFYPSGQPMEEALYDQGRQVGVYRAWLEDGTKIIERDYSRGLH